MKTNNSLFKQNQKMTNDNYPRHDDMKYNIQTRKWEKTPKPSEVTPSPNAF